MFSIVEHPIIRFNFSEISCSCWVLNDLLDFTESFIYKKSGLEALRLDTLPEKCELDVDVLLRMATKMKNLEELKIIALGSLSYQGRSAVTDMIIKAIQVGAPFNKSL